MGPLNFRDDLLGRLRRTGQFISATTYGPLADAERLIERVRRIHESVIGQLPDGTPYSASDPDLLTWVHVAEVSSFLKSYLRYLNPDLPGSEQDRYYSEIALVAERLGARAVPRDRQQIAAYLRPCVHACVATNAPAKWCGFSSTHQRPAPWPGRSAR